MRRELILNGNPMEETVGFARAVRVGPYITVGGTAPVSLNGQTVGVGDAAAQAERCFEIIGDALERAGSGWCDVVRTRLLLINIEDWEAVVNVRAKYCRDARPVDTVMQVVRFVNPEWLVEVEADAIIAVKHTTSRLSADTHRSKSIQPAQPNKSATSHGAPPGEPGSDWRESELDYDM
jgi:enamine deaminase RidA (YjgF/YER057c/UK114 family)